MQDLIKNFGIQPVLLAAQIVNFLVIFWLLKKYAYKPIFDMLHKRRKVIADGVKNAEESNKTLEKALEEEKTILKKAQAQAQTILSDAQRQATELLKEAEVSAKERGEKILEETKQEIARQTQDAQRSLATHTAELAIELLEKSLSGMIDTKVQSEVVEKAAKKLKS